MDKEKAYKMKFLKIYQLLVNKATRKGRTQMEVDEIIIWLKGYSKEELEKIVDSETTYRDFFENVPNPNEKRKLINRLICGIKVEEIKERIMQEIRYLDKLIDELAKGKSMDKILRN